MVSSKEVLSYLPVYQDEWRLVTYDQDVPDIISAILKSHKDFARYYDKIYWLFDTGNTAQTCLSLYDFCKQNIQYSEEPESMQTTALPSGMLIRGKGDCKHYAGFIAGVMSAIARNAGNNCQTEYCFASYDALNRVPYHVFAIITDENGKEYWPDPTPGAEGKIPTWWVRKKVK